MTGNWNQRFRPLGHSANIVNIVEGMLFIIFELFFWQLKLLIFDSIAWQEWDSNPRHRNDWYLKPAP